MSLKTFDSMMKESELFDSFREKYAEKSKLLDDYIKNDAEKDKKLQLEEIKSRSLQADLNIMNEKYRKAQKPKKFSVGIGVFVASDGEVYPGVGITYNLFSF